MTKGGTLAQSSPDSWLPAPEQARPKVPTDNGAQRVEPVKEAIPSSSTEGFFQDPPIVLNQLDDDVALQRSLKLFLPDSLRHEVTPELHRFGDKILSKQVMTLVADAEKNLPYLKTFSTWGKRQDELITSEGWRKLSAIGIEEGMVAIGHENQYAQYSRPWQFCKYLAWTGSSCWVTCPSLMTDGVASALRKQLSDPKVRGQTRNVMSSAYDRLISRNADFAWTTGQCMSSRREPQRILLT